MKDNIIVFMVYWSQVHFIFKASMVSFKKHLWKYLKFKQALLKRCWLHHNAHKQENVPQCDVLEKEMATHSSVLAWRIPGTGEPDGLPPMGSHRVRHDWSNLAQQQRSTWFQCFPTPNISSQTRSVICHLKNSYANLSYRTLFNVAFLINKNPFPSSL